MALHVGWGGSPLSSTAPYQRCNRSIIFLWKGVTAMTMMTYVGKQRVSLPSGAVHHTCKMTKTLRLTILALENFAEKVRKSQQNIATFARN